MKLQHTPKTASFMAMPWTLLGELTVPPDSLAGGEGLDDPLPNNPTPAFSSSGHGASALASDTALS